jgi:hypothetical protein
MRHCLWRALGRQMFMLVSEADNRTTSVFRVAGLGLSVFMAVAAGHGTFIHGHPFDSSGFGMGVAALWAAVGIGERIAHYSQDIMP